MASHAPCILLTGATGFIGHRLLAALLRRNRGGDAERLILALRQPLDESLDRLAGRLRDVRLDLPQAVRDGRVIPVSLDLRSLEPGAPLTGVRIRSILHAAAVTRFDADASGEPAATNVDGTRRLLDWAASHGVRDFHLVSSAYACGRTRGVVPEGEYDGRPDFHNAYEQSKWEAEQLCRAAGRHGKVRLTVSRPSIVVGEYATGCVAKLDGFYVTVRATELLARSYDAAPRRARHAIPLRISGRGEDRQNIVPVDYVAAMIAAIHGDPRRHGRTYHLVHPDAPTNALIKSAMESHYDIAGGRFVDPAQFDRLNLNDAERLFREVSRPVAHYFTDTPRFARANAGEVERETGIFCPGYDELALHRLFRGAREAASRPRPRRRRRRPRPCAIEPTAAAGDSRCALYFERFLPTRIALSRVARATAMDVTVRFIIDPNGGDWVCRFDGGRLTRVIRAHEHAGRVDFGYRADLDTFFKAISGRAHPQEFFFGGGSGDGGGGGAEVFGDVERALKMAMILNAFSREHPCDRRMLTGGDDDDDGERRLAC